MRGEELTKEGRQIDWDQGFPVTTAVGVVFGRQPVEGSVDFAELLFDVDVPGVHVRALQADRFTPPQAGVRDGDDEEEVIGGT